MTNVRIKHNTTLVLFNGRWERHVTCDSRTIKEVRIATPSECATGCKWYRCECGAEALLHNRMYGCTQAA